MATSIEKRQFMEPGPTRFAGRGGLAFYPSVNPISNGFAEDGSSSDDDNSNNGGESKYMAFVKKSEQEVETPILDPRDEGTSDKWVERNPSMVRLTGKHPFNSEPPLNRLMSHGFITPVSLHYVRNHGHVPKATWEDWTVEVCGLVKRPTKFTMAQLFNDFPARELPVTLVCAGNRRKEQNMIKQTIGTKPNIN